LVATIPAPAITSIDESAVNIALPTIAQDQATSVAVIQWVINAYMLCLAVFLLVGGAAGDRFGRRRVFIIGIATFGTASVWCGISSSLSELIVARVLEGIGAALLIPCSLAIIGASFSKAELGKAIGTWAGFSATPPVLARCWAAGSLTMSTGELSFSSIHSSRRSPSGLPDVICRRVTIPKRRQELIGWVHC